jgi:MarR family transcriptional regulator, organic hydroperoxide resistance regulator
MTNQANREQLNADILASMSELVGRFVQQGDDLARKLGVPVPFIKALHSMECPMAMKDLGKRMNCDPSFVTLLADMLEKRGLARREPHPADRRVKNLVLTDDGLGLRRRVETEIASRMPWIRALDDNECAQFLALLRKILAVDPSEPTTASTMARVAKSVHDGVLRTLTDLAGATDTGAMASASEAVPPAAPAARGADQERSTDRDGGGDSAVSQSAVSS